MKHKIYLKMGPANYKEPIYIEEPYNKSIKSSINIEYLYKKSMNMDAPPHMQLIKKNDISRRMRQENINMNFNRNAVKNIRTILDKPK